MKGAQDNFSVALPLVSVCLCMVALFLCEWTHYWLTIGWMLPLTLTRNCSCIFIWMVAPNQLSQDEKGADMETILAFCWLSLIAWHQQDCDAEWKISMQSVKY